MTDRNHKGHYVSSDASQLYPTEYFFWLDHWNQSVPSGSFGGWSPPTSPDTLSDCTSLDLQDISSLSLSRRSSPMEWSEASGMANGTYIPAIEDWSSCGLPVTALNAEDREATSWPSGTECSVNLGLSPVLSHESQSSRTFHSCSEPDGQTFHTSLDLPFTAEPSSHGPIVYSRLDVPSQFSPDLGLSYPIHSSGYPVTCASSTPVGLYPGCFPEFFTHGGQVAYARNASLASSPPMRPLLPRTEAAIGPTQPGYGFHRVLRPNISTSQGPQSSVRSVSNSAGSPARPRLATATPGRFSSQASSAHSRAAAKLLHPVADPTAEEFNAFIRFEHDEYFHPEASATRIYKSEEAPQRSGFAPEYRNYSTQSARFTQDKQPFVSDPELDLSSSLQSETDNAGITKVASDVDEGCHRTHPDYSRPPHTDGLYYCPYKPKGECQHKATKLKCNYDKYIDSHVKPFRCKLEACSKQEFSSTACLLRHEREAHGMHGHGDRPHLCFYTGCERGVRGNGFPRRYNLFDHMKRVHDHTDDAVDSAGSPILGGETQNRIKRAKRKPSSPIISEPAVQRQKTTASTKQSQDYFPSPEAYRDDHYYKASYDPQVLYGPSYKMLEPSLERKGYGKYSPTE